MAREAVLGTKLAPSTPGTTMMQACGTSLQAAMGIGAKIATGEIEKWHRDGLGYDLRPTDRVFEEIFKTSHRPGDAEKADGQVESLRRP